MYDAHYYTMRMLIVTYIVLKILKIIENTTGIERAMRKE